MPDAQKKPILLVEDSDEDAALFQIALKQADVTNQVIRVKSGEEAVAYLEGMEPFSGQLHPRPGVLILDLKLPGISGFAVLEWLKMQAQLQGILVIVASGYQELREVRRAYASGARSFLIKPVNELEIRNMVRGFPGYWQCSGDHLEGH